MERGAGSSRSVLVLRAFALCAFVAGVGIFVAGFSADFFDDGDTNAAVDDFTPIPLPTATATSEPDTSTPSPSPSPTPMPYDGAVMRLKIPRFEVDSLIETIGILPNGYLDTPHDPYNTGWYDIYDKPGFGGNAVFAAHVDYYPRIRGPFYDLDEMNAGDQVVIVMEDGREYVYEVISKVRYPEAEIPMGLIIDAPERPPDQEWVTLITCGGRFRPHNGVSGPGEYLDRDVVVAMRVQ